MVSVQNTKGKNRYLPFLLVVCGLSVTGTNPCECSRAEQESQRSARTSKDEAYALRCCVCVCDREGGRVFMNELRIEK